MTQRASDPALPRPRRRAGYRLGGLLAGVAAGLLPAAAAAADPLFAHERPRYRNGDDVLADCRSEEAQARGRCAGYIMAVADMLGGAAARIDGMEACLTGEESVEELLSVVERHLAANPARAHLKGDGAVAYALSLYRPCEGSGASFEERLLEDRLPEDGVPEERLPAR